MRKHNFGAELVRL